MVQPDWKNVQFQVIDYSYEFRQWKKFQTFSQLVQISKRYWQNKP